MPASPDLTEDIRAMMGGEGPIGLDRFMGRANDHYYANRDPFGAGGDFVTAPEISQMFGELIGLALADFRARSGGEAWAYVELGPGRGTLAADALRAMAKVGGAPPAHLVETSPLLRARQSDRVPGATWHDDIATLPPDRQLLVVANEFFDALPVRQFIRTVSGWRERLVGWDGEGFALVPGDAPLPASAIPPHLADADPGGVIEQRPAATTITAELARRLVAQGGVLVAIDYGHDGRAAGDTLQAVRAHAFADPLARPGTSDLTAHVDFGALAAAGAGAGARVLGPVDQGQWLTALGISDRAAALARHSPSRADEIAAAYRRLTHPDEMGALFKVLALVAPQSPNPAGFG